MDSNRLPIAVDSVTTKARLRPLVEDDLSSVWRWTADDDWNLHQRDIDILYKCHPSHWIAVEINGKIEGVIAAFYHGDSYGFIGMFIINKNMRGKGLGRMLLSALTMSDEFKRQNVALNGREHLAETYAKYGLPIKSWTVISYHGIPRLVDLPMNLPGIKVTRAQHPKDLQDIVEYDKQFHPTSREMYWNLSMEYEDVVYMITKRSGEIVGFGAISHVVTGYRIAPLYADEIEIAKLIFHALCTSKSNIHESEVIVDTTSANDGSAFIHQLCQLKEHVTYIRQYSKTELNLPMSHIYAVCTTDAHIV